MYSQKSNIPVSLCFASHLHSGNKSNFLPLVYMAIRYSYNFPNTYTFISCIDCSDHFHTKYLNFSCDSSFEKIDHPYPLDYYDLPYILRDHNTRNDCYPICYFAYDMDELLHNLFNSHYCFLKIELKLLIPHMYVCNDLKSIDE